MSTRIAAFAACLLLSSSALPASAATHFTECKAQTGSNATAIIPVSAVENLEIGDEIAVFTAEGMCAGVATWEGENLAFALWEDDPTTSAKDGFALGEPITFRVWKSNARVELTRVEAQLESVTGSATHFERDGIFVIASLSGHSTSAEDGSLPEAFALDQNFPNPFASATTIRYGLPEQAYDLPQQIPVRIELYNVVGQRVAVLVDEAQPAGWHRVTFDASGLASGTYLYRITAGHFVATRRMLVVR